jgi:hypothetical protein
MSGTKLQSYGLMLIGRIELPDDVTFSITTTLREAETWQKSTYAFVVGGEIKRIGSSKGRLRDRFASWNRDVTNALNGKKSSTPEWEAIAWRDCLQTNHGGEVYARVATRVTTPIGTFETYMDEESVLINRHKPPLNRHTNR